jgi:ubiquinone/menaquinone biosynthesis C-methylase UbiE
MPEINLLQSLPKSKRNLEERFEKKDQEVIRISRQFGKEYFDGLRQFGYGGYRYDGRWRSVARDFISHYSLKPGMRVLDIGCAKGFLVKDLLIECPGLEVFGLDISQYAILNCELEVVGRLHLGSANKLNFPDKSFDLVFSINTLHNLEIEGVKDALKEIERVSRGSSYIVVDSYRTQFEKDLFSKWVLTAKFHDFPDGWIKLFKEVGYSGDYSWTIVQ